MVLNKQSQQADFPFELKPLCRWFRQVPWGLGMGSGEWGHRRLKKTDDSRLADHLKMSSLSPSSCPPSTTSS